MVRSETEKKIILELVRFAIEKKKKKKKKKLMHMRLLYINEPTIYLPEEKAKKENDTKEVCNENLLPTASRGPPKKHSTNTSIILKKCSLGSIVHEFPLRPPR